jgi:hypothetical protein
VSLWLPRLGWRERWTDEKRLPGFEVEHYSSSSLARGITTSMSSSMPLLAGSCQLEKFRRACLGVFRFVARVTKLVSRTNDAMMSEI